MVTGRTVLYVGSLICNLYNWSYLNAEFEVIAWNEGKKGVPCSNALQCFRHWRLSADEGDHTWLTPVKMSRGDRFSPSTSRDFRRLRMAAIDKKCKLVGLVSTGSIVKNGFHRGSQNLRLVHRRSNKPERHNIFHLGSKHCICRTITRSQRTKNRADVNVFMMKQMFLPCLSLPPSSPLKDYPRTCDK